MKKLYIIGGTMGVGKTSVCAKMKQKLNNCVFLDGDWCWDSNPFRVNEETKSMVIENICFLLNQFINCSAYENIIFCWVMHEQSIIDAILSNLNKDSCDIKTISLVCSENTLRNHLSKDINTGIRSSDIIERSLSRINLYTNLNTIKINVDDKIPNEIAEIIIALH